MTEKIFYKDPEKYTDKAKIIYLKEGKEFSVLLDRTIFYPEGGGQPSDRGIIKGENFVIRVTNVKEEKDGIWHYGILEGEKPNLYTDVFLEIDWRLRREYSQEHSAQHLFSAVIEKRFGYETTGFQILEDHTKIEIPFFGDLNLSHIFEAEEETNNLIMEGLPILVYWKDEKTRIVEIPSIDVNPCGGIHVKNTKEIGLFKVLKVYRKNAQFWRIEFIAGSRILKRLEKREKEYEYIKQRLGDPEILPAIDRLLEKLSNLEKENKKYKDDIITFESEKLLEESFETLGGKVLLKRIDKEINDLRFLGQKLSQHVSFYFLINRNKQLIMGRKENFPKEKWEEVIFEISQRGYKGKEGELFYQGIVERDENLLEFLKELLTKH
ncbi:MAG: alanyl-tRNA editing protein [Dictyoglomus sp. NZ13-RE01]|nr:MAG: alanyl-tRNA editing protein [Dictyoglomus sp. NZ13-RE01]